MLRRSLTAAELKEYLKPSAAKRGPLVWGWWARTQAESAKDKRLASALVGFARAYGQHPALYNNS